MSDSIAPARRRTFARFTPDFDAISFDLAAVADADLEAIKSPFVAAALLLMKHVRSRALSSRFREWARTLAKVLRAESPKRAIAMLLTYVAEAARDRAAPEALMEVFPVRNEKYLTFADVMRRQGRRQGRQEGATEEARRALEHLLTKRFGALDAATSARLLDADLMQLREWLDRAVDARSLRGALGDRPTRAASPRTGKSRESRFTACSRPRRASPSRKSRRG